MEKAGRIVQEKHISMTLLLLRHTRKTFRSEEEVNITFTADHVLYKIILCF